MRLLATLLSLIVVGCSVGNASPDNENPNKGSGTNDFNSNNSNSTNDPNAPSSVAPASSPPNGYCVADKDCDSSVCVSNKCQEATPTDGVMNGGESDKDCGGSNAPKCVLNKKCNKNADCDSDACRYDHVCISASEKSCTGHYGGDTCGTGEVGEAGAKHESCCTRIKIPSGVSVDKFKLTAGRMRALVEGTEGNIRGWYLSNRANMRPDAVAQLDQFANQLPASNTPGEPYSVPEQLGTYQYVPDKPSSRQGCNNNPGSNGGHTYWLNKEANEYYGNTEQVFSKDYLDALPINCTTIPMMMAACAYDGGRLQTREENDAIWGAELYPWGNVGVEAGGYGNLKTGGYGQVGPAWKGMGATAGACPTCDTTFTNWSYTYQNPIGGSPANPSDYNYFISPPGRFPKDKGPFGHLDVGALMIEATGTPSTYIDDHGRSTFVYNKSGSFEGHSLGYAKYAFSPWVRYQKFSGRCAR